MRIQSQREAFAIRLAAPTPGPLESINPTGSLFVDYDPHSRTGPLGPGVTTLDKAFGVHPDKPIQIWRGHTGEQKEIVPGDFVAAGSMGKAIATSYAAHKDNLQEGQSPSDLGGKYKSVPQVLTKTVGHGDVVADPDDPEGGEYIYLPQEALMSGLKYVGGDYVEDSNPLDVVTKADLDNISTGLIEEAPASQTAVTSAIQAAVSSLASVSSVNTALNAFIQPNYLSSGNVYTVAVSPGAVGSYILSYGTQATGALTVGAPATALQAALSAFTNLTSVTVAGGTGGPYTVSLSPTVTSTLTATPTMSTGTVVVNRSPLIPTTWKGTYVAPLNSSGVIPAQYVPSKGQGYVLGPYGTTAIYQGTTGATPIRIADWNIGTQALNFQPMAFMNLLASAKNGGRPCVEILMSSGNPASYVSAGNVLIARGVGRNAWNDLQSIAVIPTPAAAGHTGLSGQQYTPSFTNIWLSAWLRDLNAQSVTVANNAITSGVAFLIQTQ